MRDEEWARVGRRVGTEIWGVHNAGWDGGGGGGDVGNRVTCGVTRKLRVWYAEKLKVGLISIQIIDFVSFDNYQIYCINFKFVRIA